jgi:hypothetical protein
MALVDLVGGDLPLPVGAGGAVGVPPSDVDVLIERLPFWLRITKDNPYQRETAQFQRDQVDQQPEAGEQSLAGWWTRSQMSFHFGAGLDYLDTTARPQPEDRLRFKTSRNVDVWTPGKVSRLNGTTLGRTAPAGEWCVVLPTDDTGGLILARPGAVEVYDGTTWTTRNITTLNPVKAFAIDGVNYYVAAIDGVYTAPIAGTSAATKLYDLPGTDVPMRLDWVKSRLMLGHGPKVYSLDQPGPTLPTELMTHPVSTWTWSAFSDGPGGILAAGYAGISSGVFVFALTQTGASTPVLGAGTALLSMPLGERVLSTCYYLGSQLILGTDRGIRVCRFDSFYGTVSLGPLTVTTEAPVSAIGGFDRYVYGGTRVNGETALVRVDLSAPLDNLGHFAWAPDLVFPTGTWTEAVSSIAFVNAAGHKVMGVTSHGQVTENDTTDPADAAWLETARIRMGTVEDKHWLYADIRGTYGDTAPIGVSIQQPGDPGFTSIYVGMVNSQQFGLRARASEWLALRFDFSEGAELSSYVVKGLPAAPRQRLIALPVILADYEVTRSRVTVGYPGWALDRLTELERLEEVGSEITVSAPSLFPQAVTCVIEKLTLIQGSDPGDATPGTGGVLQIILRTTA